MTSLRALVPPLLGRSVRSAVWQAPTVSLLRSASSSGSSSSDRRPTSSPPRLEGSTAALLARWPKPLVAAAAAPLVAPSLPDPTPTVDASALAAGWVDSTAAADLADATTSAAAAAASSDSIGSFAAHLLLDHPWPFYSPLPPYMTTIVLTAVVLRLAITLPVTLWARRREIRLKEVAVPELTQFQNEAREGLVDGCRREGYSREQYKKLLAERCKEANKAINDKHAVAPLPTILVPLVVQFPLFISLVYILRAASSSFTSPLANELLPVLGTPLLQPDTTGALPIAVGLLLWLNTDLASRARAKKDELYPYETGHERKPLVETLEIPDGKGGFVATEVETKAGWLDRWKNNIFKSFGISFAAISIFAPSCMQVYFITTYGFTLLQTFFINRADTARLTALRAHLAEHPPAAYGIRTADLPKSMTDVPPLPIGSTKQEFDQAPVARQALKIEPIKLTFDIKTGENFPHVSERASVLAKEKADAIAKEKADAIAEKADADAKVKAVAKAAEAQRVKERSVKRKRSGHSS